MSDVSVSRRSRSLRLVPVALAGVAAIVAAYFLFGPPGSGGESCGGSKVQLTVDSSTEKADLLNQMAGKYNLAGRVFGGRCATVSVYKTPSGVAMQALARGWDEHTDKAPVPQVWSPTSSLWLERLAVQNKSDVVADIKPQSITTSVLSIAMPQDMAALLRKNHGDNLGWSDILELATKGWSSEPGAPASWGQFKLARDNPHTSTSGLAATIATFHAFTSKLAHRPDVRDSDLTDPEILKEVHGVESSVVRYTNDATELMGDLYQENRTNGAAPSISALVVEEQLVYLYNKGAPTGNPQQFDAGANSPNPLVAVHPKDGTLMLDHPYIVLASATADQRAAAADFRSFLLEPDQQRRFAEYGFRDLAGKPSQTLASTVGFDPNEQLTLLDPPSADLLDKMVKAWDNVRRSARVLLVLDTSGSMNSLVDPQAVTPPLAKTTRLGLLKPAAEAGIDLLSNNDQVGLWTFSTGSPNPYQEKVPISQVGAVRSTVKNAIEGITEAKGDTALYRTARAAQQVVRDSFDPTMINAVVLLTDGENHDPDPSPAAQDLNLLLNDIDATKTETPIRLFTIPYGNDDNGRHVKELAQIAARSKAATYDASNPLDINKIFVAVFQNL